jgi:uncharacterized small protein (DUF1192 family)
VRNKRNRSDQRKQPSRGSFIESFSREVMPIDQEPILAAERARCEKIAADLERVRASLERHRSEGEPAFSIWLNGNFGEELSSVRELESKVASLGHLIARVEAEADRSNCSEREAYARLEKIRLGVLNIEELRKGDPVELAGELPPEIEEFLRISFERGFGHVRFGRGEREEAFENYKQAFREDFFEREENFDQRRERESPPPPPSFRHAPKSTASGDSRRKQIYRDLARRLHPDLNPGLSAKDRELWHEVQVAYEERNLEALETFAVLVENGGDGALSRIRSVSRLRAVSLGIQKNLKVAQKAVKDAKLHPSWGFEAASETRRRLLAERIREELDEDIAEFEVEIEYREERIARWKSRK